MNRIKELRENAKMKQSDLGRLLNVKDAAISKYETGKVPLTADTIITLSEIFHVSTDYLLGLDDSTDSPETPNTIARSLKESTFLENAGRIIAKSLDGESPSSKDGSWDYEEMADYFHISYDTLMDIFEGNIWPSLDFLESVSSLCGVSTDYLLGLTSNKRFLLEFGQFPFRFNRLCKRRLKQCMDKFEKNSSVWTYTLGISDTELYLLQEYGFIFHLQILETLCATLNVSADYLLGRTDEAGNKVMLAFANLNEDNKDIIVGEIKKTLRDQQNEHIVAANAHLKEAK